ncbi:MAG: nucleotide exchange factor GrpE [Candidatus Coatesbacteria bacterium]|nr:nucleotide exchange factor GrpE [Candidatus Coatesbacteria bacterium]
MNNPDLKAACNVLGSSSFWASRLKVEEESEEIPTHDAAWKSAVDIAEKSLDIIFLDSERFSALRNSRIGMRKLLSRVKEINETADEVSKGTRELEEMHKARAALVKDGFLSIAPEEQDESGVGSLEKTSLKASPMFDLMLESGMKLDEPQLALQLSSYWAYGRKSLARQLAKEKGVDPSQIRYWSSLLKRLISAYSEEEPRLSEDDSTRSQFVVESAEDIDEIDEALSERSRMANWILSELKDRLDSLRRAQRESLIELLFDKDLSPEALGDAASFGLAVEVWLLRDALHSPLVELRGGSEEREAELADRSAEDFLSRVGLSRGITDLGFIGGRLGGGFLDRNAILSAHERELEEYLKGMVSEFAASSKQEPFDALPGAEAGAHDARAGLDMARRTAMEIVKLRSFIKASFDLELEEVTKTVERLKAQPAEGMARPKSDDGDMRELQSTVSSMRRDIARLGKWVQDEASTAFESDMLKDMLFIVDDISRIIGHADPSLAGGIVEALEMVLSRLYGVFERRNISRIDTVGKSFNPSLHDCVGTKDVLGVEGGTVLEEISIGYRIGDKVLRPAKVIVRG